MEMTVVVITWLSDFNLTVTPILPIPDWIVRFFISFFCLILSFVLFFMLEYVLEMTFLNSDMLSTW
jgi:hypothetical protein